MVQDNVDGDPSPGDRRPTTGFNNHWSCCGNRAHLLFPSHHTRDWLEFPF
jgi:hypothetical protein